MLLNNLLEIPQYSLAQEQKNGVLLRHLNELNEFHFSNCNDFSKIVSHLFSGNKIYSTISDLPFIPVSAFKNHTLKSIPSQDVFKILTSSGTTGQEVSKVVLDKETAQLQTLGLSTILRHILGNQRLPMLIIDSTSIYANKSSYSARGAGVLGLSVFGRDHTYILDDQYQLDATRFNSFLEKYNGQPVLIFGFTFMIWQYFVQSKLQSNIDLSKAVLIHSGGWKKLTDIAVDNSAFRQTIENKFGIRHIYNFYGMVEQVGSVFVENRDGNLHCPNFAEVIIRNPLDFSVQKMGEPGLIRVLSVLPRSYPGHSILTEDIGVLIGEDDASNGWKGRHFKVIGRAKKAELRGCSDTFKTN